MKSNVLRDFCEDAPVDRSPVYGKCFLCGSIEVKLISVMGYRDYSLVGESARYPVGSGCELCS